ncbi:MAG: NADH-quinone oxidoreductase subunit F, partial [Deltaproteobacteria bacterium]|nr:NADH-quinone oxidoreductase subunit F [Deltaproteobacteria bacterium]
MEKALLRNVGRPDSHTLSVYMEGGGYGSLEKALAMSPDALIQTIKDSGLRG